VQGALEGKLENLLGYFSRLRDASQRRKVALKTAIRAEQSAGSLKM
jgi:hypothetical protein